MVIPFTKAHGAWNDFLLTWAHEAPTGRHAEIAIAICERHTGVGGDGWILVHQPTEDGFASIQLFNSDGSEAEISGNGTRCAAALLVDAGLLIRNVPILTGAGLKKLHTVQVEGNRYVFEMNMGAPVVVEPRTMLSLASGDREVTVVDVGNPQCAAVVENFGFDWRTAGAEIESHPRFPHRTNVSFVRIVDEHTIDVRFYERGAGVTMSSGTGSTGAAAAAHALGRVHSPLKVLTPAGPLDVRWENGSVHLTGPAEITARGEFFCELS